MQLQNRYNEVGINCLILWEKEVNSDIEGARNRIIKFINSYRDVRPNSSITI